MNYAEIKYYDIANGLGVRTSLFVSGCTHRCKGCFNQIAWDFQYGNEFTEETIEPENQEGLLPLVREFKKRFPQKDIWCYTGYTYETDLLDPKGRAHCQATDELLTCIDVLVDGEFIQEEADITLKFRGSRNQRVMKLHGENGPELLFSD